MKKNEAARILGKLGGQVTSEAKTAACRRNAKLGGWPKGRPRNLAKQLAAAQRWTSLTKTLR
jgi:hypothetical protein